MKKKLIALMLAGAIATLPIGLVGCSEEADKPNKSETNVPKISYNVVTKVIGKNLIVALYEKKITLHRAKVYALYLNDVHESGTNYYGIYPTINRKVVTDCLTPEEEKGGIRLDNSRIIEYPSVDRAVYDEICHVCFPDEV